MTTPTFINIDSGDWSAKRFKFWQVVNTGLNDERYVYGLWNGADTAAQGGSWDNNQPAETYSVAVYSNTSHASYGQWFDYGSSIPTIVVDNGTTVVCSTSGFPNLATFTKPTSASWIPPPISWSTTSQPPFTTTQVLGGTTNTYTWDASNSTSTRLVYTTSTTNGLVFTVNANGTGIDIDCNNATYGFTHPDDPEAINNVNPGSNSGAGGTVLNVGVGDTIYMWTASGSHWCDFVIPNFITSGGSSGGSSGGGPNQPSQPSTSKKVFHNFW